MTYYPRRPVKSFQDLEVYQKLLAVGVVIVKRIPKIENNSLVVDLHECALSLLIKIAAAHSLRFGNTEQAVRILEEIMIGCNKIVVYLELYRDLYNGTGDVRSEDQDNIGSGTIGSGTIETEFFEEQIKNILSTRFKILHLQRSWVKFTPSEIGAKKS